MLEVRASNLIAQALYARLGFRIIGRRRGYYAEPPEDALVMSASI
jgi:ribosomal-protein-alanine N-acetyltransferase